MITRRISQACTLFTLAFSLLLISTSTVLADDPPSWPPGIPWPTTMPWPTARPLGVGETWSPAYNSPTATPVPAIVVPPKPAPASIPVIVLKPAPSSVPVMVLPSNPTPVPVVAPLPVPSIPGGNDPSSPLNPNGAWQTLGAGASVWYRIGTGGVHIDAWLDAEPHSNVQMAIYAPGQLHKPVGYGTPNPKEPTRLLWSGGHWTANGDWLARIINGNPMAIRYLISSSAQDISKKTCYSYWEYIGPNLVYWTTCEKN